MVFHGKQQGNPRYKLQGPGMNRIVRNEKQQARQQCQQQSASVAVRRICMKLSFMHHLPVSSEKRKFRPSLSTNTSNPSSASVNVHESPTNRATPWAWSFQTPSGTSKMPYISPSFGVFGGSLRHSIKCSGRLSMAYFLCFQFVGISAGENSSKPWFLK